MKKHYGQKIGDASQFFDKRSSDFDFWFISYTYKYYLLIVEISYLLKIQL